MRDENVDHGNGYAGIDAISTSGRTAVTERSSAFTRCVRCGDLVPAGWAARTTCRCGAVNQTHGVAHLGIRR